MDVNLCVCLGSSPPQLTSSPGHMLKALYIKKKKRHTGHGNKLISQHLIHFTLPSPLLLVAKLDDVCLTAEAYLKTIFFSFFQYTLSNELFAFGYF